MLCQREKLIKLQLYDVLHPGLMHLQMFNSNRKERVRFSHVDYTPLTCVHVWSIYPPFQNTDNLRLFHQRLSTCKTEDDPRARNILQNIDIFPSYWGDLKSQSDIP